MFSYTDLNKIPLDALHVDEEGEPFRTPTYFEFGTHVEYTYENFKYTITGVLLTIIRLGKGDNDTIIITGTAITANDRAFPIRSDNLKGTTIGDAIDSGFDIEKELLHLCSCAIIYVASEDPDAVLAKDSEDYKKWVESLSRRKIPNRIRPLIDNRMKGVKNTYLLGEYITINRHNTERSDDEPKDSHASPVTHWRRGHYRRQNYGPKDEQQSKILFIQPTIVNAFKGNPIPQRKYKLV